MLKIYLTRHGQTDYNKKRIVQGGGIDSSLNSKGRYQAFRLFQKYNNIKFSAVYSSGLKRTYQTVKEFETLGYEINRVPELNELGWGDIEGQPVNDEIHEMYLSCVDSWKTGNFDKKLHNGESPNEVWNRVRIGLEKIYANHKDGDSILICTHGRVLCIIVSQIFNYGMEHMYDFKHFNTGMNVILKNGDKFIAEKLNDLSHLPE